MSIDIKSLMSTRNLIIILLILVIIGAGYILVTSYTGDEENVLSVKYITDLENSQRYSNTSEVITVKGYFYEYHTTDRIQVTDDPGRPDYIPTDILLIDHSNIENPSLDKGERYLFTGVLHKEGLNNYVLYASEIVRD